MSAERTARLSAMLPPSLGHLFSQRAEQMGDRVRTSTLPNPPANLPGAFAAAELCCIVDQYKPELVRPDSFAEVKLDGIRCLYIAGRLWTREGSPFEAAEHCLPVLEELEAAFGKPMFFDGEYVEDGGLEATIGSFRSRQGNGCLWLFDAVPFDEWKSGQPSRQDLRDRKEALRRAIQRVTCQGCAVGMIDHVEAHTAAHVEQYAQAMWREAFEGLVIKRASSFYVRKRTCDWMKEKLRTVSTLQVVDVLGGVRDGEETAKHVLLRLPGHGPLGRPLSPIKLSVSGSLAETIWRNRGDLTNDGTVNVEHAGFTGGGNLREPVVKSIAF